jgi:hypothetical protein
MHDHFSTPEITDSAQPIPRWVKVALFGPFLAVALSVVLATITESSPPLNEFAHYFFLVSSACLTVGWLSVFGVCVFRLFKRRGSHRAG